MCICLVPSPVVLSRVVQVEIKLPRIKTLQKFRAAPRVTDRCAQRLETPFTVQLRPVVLHKNYAEGTKTGKFILTPRLVKPRPDILGPPSQLQQFIDVEIRGKNVENEVPVFKCVSLALKVVP